jgi:Ca2+/Na+ antiporter
MQSMSAKHLLIGLSVIAIFFATRLYNVTLLPVFSDEAIYIRWTQMMRHDPEQYLFLPLYDGKTPLMMWLLQLFEPLVPEDPLLGSRLMSVLFGLGTMFIISLIAKHMSQSSRVQLISALIYICMPFTFIHDRLALTDAPMVFFLALTTWLVLKFKSRQTLATAGLTGVMFGLAILAKFPANPLYPPIFLSAVGVSFQGRCFEKEEYPTLDGWSNDGGYCTVRSVTDIPVISIFIPAQRRLYRTHAGIACRPNWSFGLQLEMFFTWQGWYSGIIFGLPLLGLFRKELKLPVRLWLMSLLWALPFILTGKIVYSRYYLPTILFLIPAASIVLDHMLAANRRAAIIFATFILAQGLWFMWPWWTDVFSIHLPKADAEQYLAEWSAGFGIPEVRDLIRKEAAKEKVVIATEGYFGTLPDGLLMYFDRTPLPDGSIEIFGTGQPLISVPEPVKMKSLQSKTYIFANEHRIKFDYSLCCEVVGRFPRPFNGPDALLLRVK